MLPGSRRFGDLRRDGLGALGAAVDADVKHRDKKAAINGSDVTNPKNSPALFASGTAAVVKEGGLSMRSTSAMIAGKISCGNKTLLASSTPSLARLRSKRFKGTPAMRAG
jgi:hypothetical protein